VPAPMQSEHLTPDERWMQHALLLAQRSVGLSSPNPAVGCVLVKEDVLIGEGFHEYDKLDHAEVVALKQAGENAKGSTAYVTLEPCSHTGRTGPCANALIAAGVKRVVAATGDPNPQVRGQGFKRLEAAGIEVVTGILCREAQELNDGFAQYIRSGLPFVTLKAGVSLDGRIAPTPGSVLTGAPVFLTGEESLAEVQKMRHASDALITGINTILNDNPVLTDRTTLPRRRRLLRVVLDSALRLRLDSRLVRTAQDDVIVFCTTTNSDRQRALEALGVRIERIEQGSANPRVSIRKVIERLGEMKITSAMLEAGGQVNSAAIAAQVVDKLSLFYAPVFMGETGVPLISGFTPSKQHLEELRIDYFGRDFRAQGYLRNPWA
jgi:diaminohydroxyphosphoribosylaminopyrimidine deaminase/5-amino-6-(5-phosphoribosylamino)uracil reductase